MRFVLRTTYFVRPIWRFEHRGDEPDGHLPASCRLPALTLRTTTVGIVVFISKVLWDYGIPLSPRPLMATVPCDFYYAMHAIGSTTSIATKPVRIASIGQQSHPLLPNHSPLPSLGVDFHSPYCPAGLEEPAGELQPCAVRRGNGSNYRDSVKRR